jgi:catechol 2,3-dioxygenase-like lactoylglutathione lyase family enzyme
MPIIDPQTSGLTSSAPNQQRSTMFSHVTVGSADLQRAATFFDAVLLPLGLSRRPVTPDGGPAAVCWISPNGTLPRFYVYEPVNREQATSGNGSMVAFLANSPEAVDKSYAAGMAAGGRDEGTPGPRPNYGDGYYGAYIRDPDGNKIHIAYRGDIAT